MAAGKSLLDRIRENSSIKETALLTESIIYNEKDIITTQVPMINVAFSGRIDGGLVPGLFELAGPSKHFKSAFGLLLAGEYLKKYADGVVLFYDSEFGTPHSYFDTFDVDKSRVIHTPITDIEQLKHDIMQQLQGIARGDRLFIFIDSIGALASKKEIEDALKGSDKADFTRAKALKSLFRMVTPHLRIKDIPMVVINHTYKEMTMFPRDIVGGGCMIAGTKVRMSDGTLKNIEDILPGDHVNTLEGSHVVTATWTPKTLEEGTPECYEVEFEDGSKYVCSDQHLFMRDGEWVEIGFLSAGDDVSVV